MRALLVGRFHAVTAGMEAWLQSIASHGAEQVVAVVTSADHEGTRRNPLELSTREAMLRPALARGGVPFVVVAVSDLADSERWVEHVRERVRASAGVELSASGTRVFSSNGDVAALFRAAAVDVVSSQIAGPTPHELLERVVRGQPWERDASLETRATLSSPAVQERLRSIFGQALVNDDGELGHARDFASYGAQMDASLKQKVTELLPWVKPGCVVDKGCGTGKLLVELARQFPSSRFVGVDLSREFLRRCDELTYAAGDVGFVHGNVIDQNVADGQATTVVYSSVMHEVHSYSGYRREEIDRALQNAHRELSPGGRVLIRDGVSPPPATWRLRLLTPEAHEMFEKFAKEFRHGAGAVHERLGPFEVRLSSHLANEFLCKKDYRQHWHLEVHEEYGAHTLTEWGACLTRQSFAPLHLAETVNPWIVTNRYEGQVALFDDAGARVPWPATNCVVVGQKPA